MGKTESYRVQHKEIHSLLSDIKTCLNVDGLSVQPDQVASYIRTLIAKFSTHLAIEDQAFYPRAMSNANAELSTTAKRFQTEMGGLSTAFDTYRKKWPGALAISSSPSDFVAETRTIIGLLERRLEREETELYELYDSYA